MEVEGERQVYSWLRARQFRGYLRYLREHPSQLMIFLMLPFMLLAFLPLLQTGPVRPVAPDKVALGGVALFVGMALYFLFPVMAGLRGSATVQADVATVSVVFPTPLRRATWVEGNLRRAFRDVTVIGVVGSLLGAWVLSGVVLTPVWADLGRLLALFLPAALLWVGLGVLGGYASLRSRRAWTGRALAVALVPLGYASFFFVLFDPKVALAIPPFSTLAWIALDLSRFLVGAPMTALDWLPLASTWVVVAVVDVVALRYRYELPGPGSSYGVADRSGLSQERASAPGLYESFRLLLRPRFLDWGGGWRALAALRVTFLLRSFAVGFAVVVLVPVLGVSLFTGGGGSAFFASVLLLSLFPMIGGFGTMTEAAPGRSVDRDILRSLPLPPREIYKALLSAPMLLFAPAAVLEFAISAYAGAVVVGLAAAAYLLSFPFVTAAAQLATLANLSESGLTLARFGTLLGFLETLASLVFVLPVAFSGSALGLALIVGAIALVNLLLAAAWRWQGLSRFDAGPPAHLRPFTESA